MPAISNLKLHPVFHGGGFPITSQTSTTVVLNANSKAKTGTNASGADSELNPYGVLGATVLNHANVYVVTVPEGSSYLDIVHEWIGTDPATLPVVRVFGEVPARVNTTREGDLAESYIESWPHDVDASYFNPGDGSTTDWKPIGSALTGEYKLTLGDTDDDVYQDNGTSKRSKPVTISVTGCSRVMVLIGVAAATPTKGLVIGWFGR